MNKKQKKGVVATIANEQRIEKMNSLFKEEKQQQLQMKMKKKQRRGVVTSITNEQRIKKRNSLFKNKEHQ